MNQTSKILQFKDPNKPFRDLQTKGLVWFEQNYNNYDVFVFDLPTAVGKSLLSVTISKFLNSVDQSVAITTPQVILQDQYSRDFPDMVVLKGMKRYRCPIGGNEENPGSCDKTKKYIGHCCQPREAGDPPVCPYLKARSMAQSGMTAIFNFHSYYVNQMYKDILILDEGHGVRDLLYEFYTLKLWQCELGYADDMPLDATNIKGLINKIVADLRMELSQLESQHAGEDATERVEKEITRLSHMTENIDKFFGNLLIRKHELEYKGKVKDTEGNSLKNTKQEYIYVKPLTIDKIGEDILWPKFINKIIFLSATISERDIKTFGLDKKRVGYFKSDSPISPSHRNFVYWPHGSMSKANREYGLPKIIVGIEKLAAKYSDKKGLVHCTYDTAKKFKEHFGKDQRYIFHEKHDKMEKYEYFRALKTGSKIFVASGMEEGIDLAFDTCRWQVITQVMKPYYGDFVNQYIAHHDKETYAWEAVKSIIQQTGRICRDPIDWGVTYMLDSEFGRFYEETKNMWPDYFKIAMIFPKKL